MKNIDLNYPLLAETISLLENDHNEILELLKEVSLKIEEIDEKKWSSNSRKKFDENFKSYVKKLEPAFNFHLNKNILFLKKVLQEYGDTEKFLASKNAESSQIATNGEELY